MSIIINRSRHPNGQNFPNNEYENVHLRLGLDYVQQSRYYLCFSKLKNMSTRRVPGTYTFQTTHGSELNSDIRFRI